MSWLDSYSERYFKQLRDGRIGFYPYPVGRGYIVSEQQRRVLSRYLTRGFVIGLAMLLFFDVLGTFFFAALFASLFLAVFWAGLQWLTRGLERTDERLTMGERYRAQAQRIGSKGLLAGEALAGLFIACGLYLAMKPGDSSDLLVGIIGIIFGVFIGWTVLYMLYVKAAEERRES